MLVKTKIIPPQQQDTYQGSAGANRIDQGPVRLIHLEQGVFNITLFQYLRGQRRSNNFILSCNCPVALSV